MILCATLASGLWLLLQRTKTDTRWRQFQPVWFGRRSADLPTLFNPWETVSICPAGSIQGLQILSTDPSAPLKFQLTQHELMRAIVINQSNQSFFQVVFKFSQRYCSKLDQQRNHSSLWGFIAMRKTDNLLIQTKNFLATLVALHFTPVSERVGGW